MTTDTADIKELFETGAHYGYSRSRRHPSAEHFIFGTKDRVDVLDLEETGRRLDKAQKFIAKVAGEGRQVLFIGSKHEAAKVVKDAAERLEMPFVTSRWIGGTLTNFKEIRRRLDRLERLRKDRDSGDRESKYTKLERLKMDREIEELEGRFGGLSNMANLPAALFVVDPRHEEIAVKEANQMHIPVVALASTDCDFNQLQYPIPANDSVLKSIKFFVGAIVNTFEKNKKSPKAND